MAMILLLFYFIDVINFFLLQILLILSLNSIFFRNIYILLYNLTLLNYT